MNDANAVLLVDLRGRGPVVELRIARSVGQLCAGGAAVVVVPLAGDADAVALLTARLRQRARETPAFALGTRWIGEAQAGHLEGFRVAVGDDTVGIVSRFNQAHRLSHVSPSGDALVNLLVSGAYEDPTRALGIAVAP